MRLRSKQRVETRSSKKWSQFLRFFRKISLSSSHYARCTFSEGSLFPSSLMTSIIIFDSGANILNNWSLSLFCFCKMCGNQRCTNVSAGVTVQNTRLIWVLSEGTARSQLSWRWRLLQVMWHIKCNRSVYFCSVTVRLKVHKAVFLYLMNQVHKVGCLILWHHLQLHRAIQTRMESHGGRVGGYRYHVTECVITVRVSHSQFWLMMPSPAFCRCQFLKLGVYTSVSLQQRGWGIEKASVPCMCVMMVGSFS